MPGGRLWFGIATPNGDSSTLSNADQPDFPDAVDDDGVAAVIFVTC